MQQAGTTTAPWYRQEIIQEWISASPDVRRRLRAGGLALDVGCGGGLATIALAQAFPEARTWGFDTDPLSVQRARANARAAGVADRVCFEVAEGARVQIGPFDLITASDLVRDAVDPLALMTSIRGALAEDGTFLMLETNASRDDERMAAELAEQAGFSHFRRLVTDDPFAVVYEIRE